MPIYIIILTRVKHHTFNIGSCPLKLWARHGNTSFSLCTEPFFQYLPSKCLFTLSIFAENACVLSTSMHALSSPNFRLTTLKLLKMAELLPKVGKSKSFLSYLSSIS